MKRKEGNLEKGMKKVRKEENKEEMKTGKRTPKQRDREEKGCRNRGRRDHKIERGGAGPVQLSVRLRALLILKVNITWAYGAR